MKYFLAIVSLTLVLSAVFWSFRGAPNRPSDESPSETADSAAKPIAVGADVPFVGRDGYATSSQCTECHSDQHASWHRSYHRTMTQIAGPDSVLAPFRGETVSAYGRDFTMTREGDVFVVDMPDPKWEVSIGKRGISLEDMQPPRQRQRVALTTGSHHLQTYWIATDDGNKLRQLPWVYHIKEQLWMPNEASFLQPLPDAKDVLLQRQLAYWNYYCINCHAVGGQINGDFDLNWKTRVAEFGIACEACHGPAAAHVEYHRQQRDQGESKVEVQQATLVNPERCSPKVSSEICGQCHADVVWPTREKNYGPGDDLMSMCTLHGFENPLDPERFWGDGTMRVGGREFNAMQASKCYTDGNMSCLSCHSMHEGSRDDQLGHGMRSDEACLQCHNEYRAEAKLTEHTHHAAGSAGSQCYNCHMPYTTYALFKGIRSHRVDVPSVATSVKHGRPNSCNQCHLNRSLSWTADAMQKWYGVKSPSMPEMQQELPASAVWLLTGDAVQRALAAWNYRWAEATATSGSDWQPALLIPLLRDPYPAVRFIAAQSLQSRPEFADWEFDYMADESTREAAIDAAKASWRPPAELPPGLEGLFNEQRLLRANVVQQLIEQRDDRHISLSE